MDEPIISDKIQIERKLFFFDLKQNQRGILLRITEDVRGRRDTIIIPATGLHDFQAALQRMVDAIEDQGLDPRPMVDFDDVPSPVDNDY
jgi:hypothetical protein